MNFYESATSIAAVILTKKIQNHSGGLTLTVDVKQVADIAIKQAIAIANRIDEISEGNVLRPCRRCLKYDGLNDCLKFKQSCDIARDTEFCNYGDKIEKES